MLKKILFGGAECSRLADVGLLIVRVYMGLAFVLVHGLAKLTNPQAFIDGTAALGLPAPKFFGWMAIFAEFGGGLLLALGLATRPAAFLIASTMAVAGFMAHAHDPFQVKELAFTYLALAILFMFTGSGRYGVDALVRGK